MKSAGSMPEFSSTSWKVGSGRGGWPFRLPVASTIISIASKANWATSSRSSGCISPIVLPT